jgi:hypothetical protein
MGDLTVAAVENNGFPNARAMLAGHGWAGQVTISGRNASALAYVARDGRLVHAFGSRALVARAERGRVARAERERVAAQVVA